MRRARAAASPAAVRFADVTRQAGLRFRHVSGAFGRKYLPETMGAGVAVLDYDGDTDLFVSALGPDRQYRNDGGNAGSWSASS